MRAALELTQPRQNIHRKRGLLQQLRNVVSLERARMLFVTWYIVSQKLIERHAIFGEMMSLG